VHVGNVHQTDTKISVVDYGKDHCESRTINTLEEVLDYRNRESITWVIVEGLADSTIIESIGQHFNIHPLVLEDILNTHQRPKLEEHENYLYVVLKSLTADDEDFSINYEQVSLLVLKNFIFTFKEKADSLLMPLQKRIKSRHGRVRSAGADYLMYMILDTIVDLNFDITDRLEEELTLLEDEIFTNPTPAALGNIHEVKRQIIKMRRYVAPIRDLLAGLWRSDSDLINESTHIYLRDVYDHILRIIESLETHREILSGLTEIYLSTVSSKMNEVMKVLTVFASIFIPLTFITGIYGMNFENMPELKWAWGYPGIWVIFLVITVSLFFYFKRKGWS
jgi:magnesium transporter